MRTGSRFAMSIVILAAAASLYAQQPRPSSGKNPQRQNQYYQQRSQRTAAQAQQGNNDLAARPQRGGDQIPPTKEQELSSIFSQIVIAGLNNPCGVAIQPTSNQVYIADSGAARIVRLHDVPGQYRVEPVITGFPQEGYGKNPTYKIGPLGLAFINKYTLAVGGGGLPAGEDTIGVYRISQVGAIDAADILQQLGPLPGNPEAKQAVGNFFGLAATPSALLVACDSADKRGWIAKADVTGGNLEKLAPFVKPDDTLNLEGPTSIAIGRRGEMIVSQMGEPNVPSDSHLTFYELQTGKAYLDVAAKLNDVVSIAVSPQSGRIYALDFSWMAPNEGGLYRLDLTKDGDEWICKPALLMPLDRPSAMAFSPDGELFITTFGSHSQEHKGGLLVRIYNDSKL
jgi:hypothetical protein